MVGTEADLPSDSKALCEAHLGQQRLRGGEVDWMSWTRLMWRLRWPPATRSTMRSSSWRSSGSRSSKIGRRRVRSCSTSLSPNGSGARRSRSTAAQLLHVEEQLLTVGCVDISRPSHWRLFCSGLKTKQQEAAILAYNFQQLQVALGPAEFIRHPASSSTVLLWSALPAIALTPCPWVREVAPVHLGGTHGPPCNCTRS